MSVPLTTAVESLTGFDLPAHRQHTAAGIQQAIAAAAATLGLSTQELRSELSSGSSLEQVAMSKGVPLDALTTSVTQALVNADPPATPERAAVVVQRLLAQRPAPAPAHLSAVDLRL